MSENRPLPLPPLDAHAHLAASGAQSISSVDACIMAMTVSLEEASLASKRQQANIMWGVGCHPRLPQSQERFDLEEFACLVSQLPIVGEIGLDQGSHASMARQLETFRACLRIVAELHRIVSIHSYRSTSIVLRELRHTPVRSPILHWWTGSAAETSQAVKRGCYFSIHSAIARQSKFRTRVPKERLLVETDHGYRDPPLAIPCRIQWVEHLLAQQLDTDVARVRMLAWNNFRRLVDETETADLLPLRFREVLEALAEQTEAKRLL